MNENKIKEFNDTILKENIKNSQYIIPISVKGEGKVSHITMNNSNTLIAFCDASGFVYIMDGFNFNCLNKFNCRNSLIQVHFDSKEDFIFCLHNNTYVHRFNVYQKEEEQIPLKFKVEDHRMLMMDFSFGDMMISLVCKNMYKETFLGGHSSKILVLEREKLMIKDSQDDNELSLVTKKIIIPQNDKNSIVFSKFDLKAEILFICIDDLTVEKYNLNSSNDKREKTGILFNKDIKSINFTVKFEFLLVSGDSGVVLLRPNDLSIISRISTIYPVKCAHLLPMAYSQNPRFNIIFGGGIPAVEQARTKGRGNEVYIYDLIKEESIIEIEGAFGNINWIEIFKDGSGFLTAGEEGYIRIYRFNNYYFTAPFFN